MLCSQVECNDLNALSDRRELDGAFSFRRKLSSCGKFLPQDILSYIFVKKYNRLKIFSFILNLRINERNKKNMIKNFRLLGKTELENIVLQNENQDLKFHFHDIEHDYDTNIIEEMISYSTLFETDDVLNGHKLYFRVNKILFNTNQTREEIEKNGEEYITFIECNDTNTIYCGLGDVEWLSKKENF